MKYIDMSGQTLGLWRVLQRDEEHTKRAYWVCACVSCGTLKSVSGTHLREGMKGGCKPCKHAGNQKLHPEEYSVWQNIKTRTTNINRRNSERYIALGMYEPWKKDFEAFLKEIGKRPSHKHSIDRIDNEKGYFPGNVRWATPKEQGRNTRRNLRVEGKILIDYAKEVRILYNTLRDRYHKNAI